jgi:hypothetical protein
MIKKTFFQKVIVFILISISLQLKCPEGFEEVPLLYFENQNQTDYRNNLIKAETYNFKIGFENQFSLNNRININKFSSDESKISSINIILSNISPFNNSNTNLTNFSFNLLAKLNIKENKIEFHECLIENGCSLNEDDQSKKDSSIKNVRQNIII